MTPRFALCFALALALAGCGASKLNPFNWFGRSEARAQVEKIDVDEDGRLLVADVLSMTIEQMPGGAIVRATGLSPSQGWWDAELVPRPLDENGLLVLDFRISPPLEPTRVSTPQSRDVTAARFLSDIKLGPVREIVVQGANNARATRR